MKEVLLNNGTYGFEFEDIRFCNTHLFNEAARFHKKNGVYTLAPEGTNEYKDFWDEEERRIHEGMTAPGRLLYDSKGQVSMQEVHITGDHYAYLNYGQIKLTNDIKEVHSKSEKVVKDITNTMVARKEVSFPSFWDGDYHYFKAKEKASDIGRNLYVMKARRKGYSYKNGFIVAKTAFMRRRSTSIIGAYDNKYLIKGDGTMVMCKNYLDFIFEETDFNRGYLSDPKDFIQLGYKEEGSRIKKGYKSQILALSFMDNPDAAIGKDAELIVIDEAGKFPNLKEMYDVTQPTLEDGDVIVGIMIVFGTGGSEDANWEAFEEMYYNPLSYNGIQFNNVWDEGGLGQGVGFFHSHALNLKPYVDEDGNSDIEKATRVSEARRLEQKATAKNASTVNGYTGQRCLKPSEGFNRTQDNLFSSKELDDHIAYVANNPDVTHFSRKGVLAYADNRVKFTYNEELPEHRRHDPIVNFPHRATDDVHGCYVEWYAPYRDPQTGLIPGNMYRIWVDPFAHDKDKDEIRLRDSLGSIYVYERANSFSGYQGDVLVACYVGRPSTIDEFNEIALKITKYYNAMCHPEVDRGDVVPYFRRAGFYHLLADEPEAFFRKQNNGKTQRNKGTKIGADIDRKGHAAIMLKEWLYKVRKTTDGGTPIYNFQYIYDLPLLKELQKWNLKGNFDRVSALLVGMYDKQDVLDKEIEDATSMQPDDFFTRSLY